MGQERAKYDVVVSEIVETECNALLQQTTLLTVQRSILDLALTAPTATPPSAALDAIHVAAAVIHRCDYLLTWNLRHIANTQIRRVVEGIHLHAAHVRV